MAEPFQSYAQNGEDIVLMRALGDVPDGRYVDVGANDAVHASISYAFYRLGWHGITVEPAAEFAADHLALRPRDTLVQVAVTDAPVESVVLHAIAHTGLSTTIDDIARTHGEHGWEVVDTEVPARRLDTVITEAGFAEGPIHFVTVDVEGAEPSVLASIDLDRIRPWVFVVESTLPNTTERTHQAWEHLLLDHGYTATLFDGLSRYYVADEHLDRLTAALSYPVCVFDEYDTESDRRLRADHDALRGERDTLREELVGARADKEVVVADLVRWRTNALTRWAGVVGAAPAGPPDHAAAEELARMRATVSWRVTRPLRSVRTRLGALRR